MSTRVITRSSSLVGVLGFLAASAALAQIGSATIIAAARAASAPSISLVTTNSLGQVEPSPDQAYANNVRKTLADSEWMFLASNVLLVVRDSEVLMTMRAIPGFDGSSWQVSNTTKIGTATHTVSGLVRRGIRLANGTFDRNLGVADLTMTTVSIIGRRASAHVLVPLTFGTPPTGVGTVVENGNTTTFTTGAQGGVVSSGSPGGVVSTGTNNPGGPVNPDNSVRQPPGWGVRLWPVPWG